MPKVAVVMGSHKDFSAVEPCIKQLAALGIEVEARVLSAHRTPEEAAAFARLAQENGIEVIIAAAGYRLSYRLYRPYRISYRRPLRANPGCGSPDSRADSPE